MYQDLLQICTKSFCQYVRHVFPIFAKSFCQYLPRAFANVYQDVKAILTKSFCQNVQSAFANIQPRYFDNLCQELLPIFTRTLKQYLPRVQLLRHSVEHIGITADGPGVY